MNQNGRLGQKDNHDRNKVSMEFSGANSKNLLRSIENNREHNNEDKNLIMKARLYDGRLGNEWAMNKIDS